MPSGSYFFAGMLDEYLEGLRFPDEPNAAVEKRLRNKIHYKQLVFDPRLPEGFRLTWIGHGQPMVETRDGTFDASTIRVGVWREEPSPLGPARDLAEKAQAVLTAPETRPEPAQSTPAPVPVASEPKEPFSEKALLAFLSGRKGHPSVRNRDIAKETAEKHFGVEIEHKQVRAALTAAGIKGEPGAPKGPRRKSGK
jgi:hypothetical protein